MARFVYQSLKFVTLSVYLKIEGRAFRVLFEGGQQTPQKICGKFITTDPVIQSALERTVTTELNS